MLLPKRKPLGGHLTSPPDPLSKMREGERQEGLREVRRADIRCARGCER
jgi:hypothetical protein